MTPDYEPDLPQHGQFVRSAWALRGHSPNAVTRLPTHLPDGILGQNCATGFCHADMYDGAYAGPSTLKETPGTSGPSMTFYAEGPEFGPEEDFEENSADQDMVLQSDQDALRVAYAYRHNLVLDSTAPHLAPHIVITPPEKNVQDYYIPWLNATGPQWPSHLMVTMSANAMDYTLACVPSIRSPLDNYAPASTARAVFSLSKLKAFVASTMHERAHFENILSVLQKQHRKAVAFAASEIGRRLPACDPYVCPSEKPFRWTDPAEPFLQRTNQYRGSTIIESPSPFTVPHIIINEPPPQDPWIAWHNATTNPQDHGFGRYLTVPHRLVYHAHVPDDDSDDFWMSASSSQSAQTELPDFSCQEDLDSSGSSSSESEPETPDPDSLMDDFVLEEDGHEYIGPDVEDGMDINFFDSYEDSPWSGIINRYSAKTATFVSVADSNMTCDEDDDELPPFDDWYQSIAARTRLATMTA